MNRIQAFYQTRFNIILAVIVMELALAAWSNRFIQDDAFVSFRYAENLVNGHGLVWNVGERVEGYTNFLWTLAMSIPLCFGRDPVMFSLVLGILFFVFSLVVTYKMALLVCRSKDIGLLTILLLGANYTFISYATGGWETQLQTCMFVTSMYILLRSLHTDDWSSRTMVVLSLLTAAAILTRPDSALLLVVIIPVTLFFLLKDQIPLRNKLIKVLVLFLPLVILVGGWLIWKLAYYGDVVPNTFYAKVSSATSPQRGIFYIYKFFLSYLLIPFPLFYLVALKALLNKSNLKMFALVALILLWALYVVVIGGDFMEFRLMVPILPVVFVLIAWLIFVFIQQTEIRAALFILVLLGSLHHASTFGEYSSVHRIIAIRQLATNEWDEMGRVLGKSLHYDARVTIATTPAGAIPSYSRLKTIDMHGMNDRWVARHGDIIGSVPGHQRIASLSYLLEREVNIVIGYPWTKENTTPPGLVTR